MKLVTRYVVREHVGPLVFALTALTSLLMLQYVARQLANLAGKGLPWTAIAQFFVLSLPFTIAMTTPMAVLVATMYAFGRMAAEHEITAFKASGVRVRTLMLPVLFCAFLLSLVMVGFNDQILSRANHQLRILQQDIARTKPTLALKDQVLNAINDQFYIRVARSDASTNSMTDVVLYDLSKGTERKTVYADSGIFLLAPNGKDLQLRLFHGHSQALTRGDARRLQRDYFQQQTIQLRGITQGFEASKADNYKGEREMSVCEMQRKYIVTAQEFARVRQEYIMFASRLVPAGTKSIRVPRDRPMKDWLGDFYCVTLPKLLSVKALKAQSALSMNPTIAWQPPVTGKDTIKSVPQTVNASTNPPGTTIPQPRTDSAQALPPSLGVPTPSAVVPPGMSKVETAEMYRAEMLAANLRLTEARSTIDNVAVEIQKKFALSFACLVFVLFGPPIALRYPRGGVGVTIGVSIAVFGLYYVCLMGGETLADKGFLPAWVAMWIANVIFSIVGIMLLWRVESTTDRSRGGGFRERWADRKVRRQLAAERMARTA